MAPQSASRSCVTLALNKTICSYGLHLSIITWVCPDMFFGEHSSILDCIAVFRADRNGTLYIKKHHCTLDSNVFCFVAPTEERMVLWYLTMNHSELVLHICARHICSTIRWYDITKKDIHPKILSIIQFGFVQVSVKLFFVKLSLHVYLYVCISTNGISMV